MPYTTSYSAEKHIVVDGRIIRTTEEKVKQAHAYFLPEKLRVTSTIDPSVRRRGIYDAVVYRSGIRMEGEFGARDVRGLDVDPARLRWEQAFVAIGVSDLRGTQETLRMRWNDQQVALEPSTRLEGLASGVHAPVGGVHGAEPIAFSCELALNGSGTLRFAPVGKESEVSLRSTWPDPSFTGAVLPAERSVSDQGFSATWKASYYGRHYLQQWVDAGETETRLLDRLPDSSFGVSLEPTVGHYRGVERAIKYGVLFIVLLFTAFFLFEILSALRLHAIHYLLVGAALCLFYLGLLSLSEFTAFPIAYISAAAVSTVLIGGYCRSILRSGGRAFLITGALTVIYGLLYFILQMQDYALLAGTVALFAVLGVVMFTTRRVDWAGTATN